MKILSPRLREEVFALLPEGVEVHYLDAPWPRAVDFFLPPFGQEEVVRRELAKHDTAGLQLAVVDAPEVVGMDEHPVAAVRAKRPLPAVCACSSASAERCETPGECRYAVQQHQRNTSRR